MMIYHYLGPPVPRYDFWQNLAGSVGIYFEQIFVSLPLIIIGHIFGIFLLTADIM